MSAETKKPTTPAAPEAEPPELVELAHDDRAPLAFDELATIHARLGAILAELPAIGKGQWNDQQKFHFRGHDDVMNALNPLLGKHGVYVLPRVLERDAGTRPTRSGGMLIVVNLHVEYRFVGLAGDEVAATAWGEGTDSGDKATSKSMTMAFKSVLGQVFALATADTIDPDATGVEQTAAGQTASSSSGSRQPARGRRDENATATQEDLTRLFAALGELGKYDATFDRTWLDRSILDNFACESPKNLTLGQAASTTTWIRER
jgi:hypothetical protein